MKIAELKPCPFCGSKNISIKTWPVGVQDPKDVAPKGMSNQEAILRGIIGFVTPRYVVCDDCGMRSRDFFGDDTQTIIEEWNRRV